MRSRYKPKINHNSEFELDLAPLLAVMVKLVPVLLLSSAFVQMMIIETDLPQVVKQAIAQQEKKSTTSISLEMSNQEGVRIVITDNGQQTIQQIANTTQSDFDYEKVQLTLREIKKQHPEVFKIEFAPAADVSYKKIVKMMDEARRSRSNEIKFPVKDETSGKMTTTDYMFPEVFFNNMFEG